MNYKDYTTTEYPPPGGMAERGAIVIVIYNNLTHIGPCLESLKEHAPGDVSIVVVDNGSKEPQIEAIREDYPYIHGIRVDTNFGIARGNNVGARYALKRGTKRIYFLNDDTVVTPGFWEQCEREMETNGAQIVGSVPVHYSNPEKIQTAGAMIRGCDMKITTRGINSPNDGRFEQFYPCDAVVGCCWMLDASVFEKAGFFDESFFMYQEEYELCIRAREAGLKAGITGRSRVLHKGGGSTGRVAAASPMFIYFYTRNFIWMGRIHCTPLNFWLYLWWGTIRTILSYFRRQPGFRWSPRRWKAALIGVYHGYTIKPGTYFMPKF